MTLGQSPSYLNATKYTGDQIADVPCVSAPRAPTTSDLNYPLFTLWRNANKLAVPPDGEGDMWYLAKFTPNGANAPLAIWIKLSSGLEPSDMLTLSDNAGVKALPDVAGNIQLAAGNGISTTTTATSQITVAAAPIAGATNLGISYAASLFSVTSSTGAPLSGSAPAYVVLPSKVSIGTFVKYTVISNQSFVDSTGASTIIGNSFGVTNTANTYLFDVPFYIYAVSNSSASTPETTVIFMISRASGLTTSPLAAKIAKSGSALASTQGSFFALNAAITVADYASSPCLCLGSFRMQMSAINNWAVSALSINDGIGYFNDNKLFAVPAGSFGASTSKFFTPNGGDTPPGFTAQVLTYSMSRAGFCRYNCAFTTCNVDGVGANSLTLALPFVIAEGGVIGSGLFQQTGPAYFATVAVPVAATNTITQQYSGNGFSGILTDDAFTSVGAQSNSLSGTYFISSS